MQPTGGINLNLVKLLKQAKLTQKQLAERTGLSTRTISNAISNNLTLKSQLLIAEALKVEPHEIVTPDGFEFRDPEKEEEDLDYGEEGDDYTEDQL